MKIWTDEASHNLKLCDQWMRVINSLFKIEELALFSQSFQMHLHPHPQCITIHIIPLSVIHLV
jgi:hypothetical protein